MLDNSRDVRVVAAGGGEALDIFGGTLVLKADGGTVPVMLGEQTAPPGYFVPPHRHAVDDEMFYVLEGEITLLDGVSERLAGPGSCVTLPAGSLHGFRNDGATAARFLVICRPGVQAAEMFRHFDRAGKAAPGGLAPPEIVGIAAAYGVSMG